MPLLMAYLNAQPDKTMANKDLSMPILMVLQFFLKAETIRDMCSIKRAGAFQ